ncbi:MAG: DUF2029 domain-containing protein [Bacteroidetes bacterium]|nr:DUF2029 domain-containing protein [Bacteroidota bacterium]
MKIRFLKEKILRYNFLLIVYVVSAVVFFLPRVISKDYNNYQIFSHSFDILKVNGNLYLAHPEYYWDLYRYTPSFAVLISPFSFFPESIGVLLWNILNAAILFFGVKNVFRKDERKGALVLCIIFIEFITAIQNCQANALVTGIILLAFAGFEENKIVRAGFFVVLNLFIKIYGFASAALFLLYPKKMKFIFSSALFFIAFISLPLIFISPQELKEQYKSEFASVISYSTGLSIMAVVSSWFKIDFNFLCVQVPALFFLLLPVVFLISHKEEKIKYLFISSIMIFLVSFNQMAESATYIIGVTGAAMWFVNSEKNKINIFLLVLLIFFCILAPSDVYPKFLRENFFTPYKIKAVPLFIIWLKVQYDIWKIILVNPKLFFQAT